MGIQAARIVFPEEDRAEIAAAIAGILASGTLTLGPYTQQFEQAFAAAHCPAEPAGATSTVTVSAVATSSGTAALEIALRSVGVAGKDVVVPANTFYATAAAVIAAGGRPVFADIDPATFALSPRTLADALTPNTAAVVLVHIGGLITPHAHELRRRCDEIGAALVEDAAHAHGSTLNGQFAGAFGVAAAFSFYPTKVVTSGEGGMILTTSDHLAAEARIYRDQGKGAYGANHHIRHGYAWRMSELNAVTGLVHLRRMAQFIARRREVAARYDAALAGIAFPRPIAEPPGCRSNIYKYLAVLPPQVDRTWLKSELAARHEVRLAGEVYDLPLHRQPVFAEFIPGGPLPAAEDLCLRHVCLPVHSDMTDDEVDQVAIALAEVAARAAASHGERACASR
ncbi:MAG TPA: DegT/DnrJ/EryC1/StrS family aminotransferase [Streptosporangiaceae bacterium]|nr:DegT/DnrJ/EryC1/StrS family aminotransferase [Streptosporangiaceae bacterium]